MCCCCEVHERVRWTRIATSVPATIVKTVCIQSQEGSNRKSTKSQSTNGYTSGMIQKDTRFAMYYRPLGRNNKELPISDSSLAPAQTPKSPADQARLQRHVVVKQLEPYHFQKVFQRERFPLILIFDFGCFEAKESRFAKFVKSTKNISISHAVSIDRSVSPTMKSVRSVSTLACLMRAVQS